MSTSTQTASESGGALAWKDKLVDYVISHSGSLITALVVIVVGFLAARWLGSILNRMMERKAMEPPMRMLLTRIVRLLVVAFALVIALETAGMDMTVLIASFSVAGIGMGLALQGVLGNMFAGLTIIFTKPFRVGEYIEIANVQGQVQTIALFSTTLLHPDRSRVVIPNRKVVGEILHNYGSVRQLDLSVGVAYGTDLNHAVGIVRTVLAQNPRILKDPVPFVGVSMLADSSINIAIRPWTAVADFGFAQIEVNQAVAEQLRAASISIPFPQREIRLVNQALSSSPSIYSLPGQMVREGVLPTNPPTQ
ncbi:MAG TPA: mechanosensitive ion channel domain-containing protein [Verrucomicrobiae bacterium]|jgi:small conductance mechanosensitive channel|nr:mechanosensitive ion channel domain-containing protein [Verrucomicrobiae bacterium]